MNAPEGAQKDFGLPGDGPCCRRFLRKQVSRPGEAVRSLAFMTDNGVFSMAPDKDDPSYESDLSQVDRFYDFDEEGFERIRKSERGNFPTAGDRRARRSAHETYNSKKVRKTLSKKGGMHRRRQKKSV